MKIIVGADHGGFELKGVVSAFLTGSGHQVIDLGVHDSEPSDYPDIARAVALAIRQGTATRGILFCGSGVGAAIAANKFPGIRAGVCHDTFSARQGVEDDDMNVLCLGGRIIGPGLALEVVERFVGARFSGAERHVRRLGKVNAIEKEFLKPAAR